MVDFIYKSKYNVDDFREIIKLLRSENGCPWDKEQTHESIRRNFLEETYEVCEAIDKNDKHLLQEELGDVLMQVIFHSSIEEDAGVFNLDDVADMACKKLIYRHPHVFSDTKVNDSTDVMVNWEELKQKEKSQTTITKTMSDVAESLPSLWRAEKVQKKAAKVNFDWPNSIGAMEKICEELDEVKEAKVENSKEHLEEELGDLLFAVVNYARLEKIDPEQALHKACEKFISRFNFMEKSATDDGKNFKDLSFDEMDQLWNKAKL